MKKLVLLAAVFGTAITLSGCDLNNDQMKDIITKCKEDVECKEILDNEIDEALAERGITGDNFTNGYDDYYFYEDFDDYEFTEEEMALFDVIDALDEELFDKLDSMDDEEFSSMEQDYLTYLLDRELTTEEVNSIELVEALYSVYETDVEIEFPEFATETEYLVHYLGRELTTEEIEAFEVIDTLFSIDENMVDEEFELTETQEDALEVIDALYEEAFENMEAKELSLILDRELTDEETVALDLVNELYKEAYGSIDEEYDYIQETVNYYEFILDRELTETEKEALTFSMEWEFDYFYECDDIDFDLE